MHRYRSHTCGDLRETDIGKEVRLSGWCHRIRDHGGLLFIDLRDHYGIAQLVVDPESAAFKEAEKLRSEWVVRIDGRVRKRPAGTDNPELPTGAVEVYVKEIEVLGPAGELPMQVFGELDYPEDIRLRYRFLDLRRERLHRNIMLRGAVIDSIRRRMKEQGFFEFQTPILTASSPEGARDYLVPSRLHPGKFYALPQAPQQFKQLVMISGFDRYFQIAPCFRDEDARADRSPGEFYQLDLEMSFVTQQDVFDAVEPVMRGVFEEFSGGKPVTAKFPLIPYAQAMREYGTDKPDLRNPDQTAERHRAFPRLGIQGLCRAHRSRSRGGSLGDSGAPRRQSSLLRPHERMGEKRGAEGAGVHHLRQQRRGERCELRGSGASGSARDQHPGEECGRCGARKGPIANNIGAERTQAIREQLQLAQGDAVFFIAGRPRDFIKFAGAVRTRVGEELGLVAKERFELCWIVDFPMYEWNEDEKKIDFSHNPFSMPNMPVEEFLALDARRPR